MDSLYPPSYRYHEGGDNQGGLMKAKTVAKGSCLITDSRERFLKGNNVTKTARIKGQSPVEFSSVHDNGSADDDGKGKKKYLTAKYGQHQMHRIKKRLNVESWIITRLQDISKEIGVNLDGYDIDVDDILNIEEVYERKIYLQKHFKTINSTVIKEFIREILSKVEHL